MSCWHCGNILVSYTRGGWVSASSPFTVMTNILSLNSANSVKTFREKLGSLLTKRQNVNHCYPFEVHMVSFHLIIYQYSTVSDNKPNWPLCVHRIFTLSLSVHIVSFCKTLISHIVKAPAFGSL